MSEQITKNQTEQQPIKYNKQKRQITLLLCLLGGFLGLHLFYNNDNSKGLLYILTFGLCGIGWLIDLFRIIDGTFFVEKPETNYQNYNLIRANQNIKINTVINQLEKSEVVLSEEPTKKQLVKERPDIKTSSITKSTSYGNISDFVVIDVETTGLRPSYDKIIQLSAIRFENFEPVEYFDTYINPKIPIPQEATKVNFITDSMVADSPNIEYVINSFSKFVGKQAIVGHNIYFDLKFLWKNGYDFTNNKIYDTLELSKKAFPYENNYKLMNLCRSNNIETNAHNSLADCYSAGMLFKLICKRIIR